MSRSLAHKVLRSLLHIVLWTIGIVVGLVVIIFVLLYIPGVQEWAKNVALEQVNKGDGMKITVDKLHLRFPLRLSVEGVTILEASGDTMVRVQDAAVDLRVAPLFKGTLSAGDIQATNAMYQMGNQDSAMWIIAKGRKALITDASMDLINSRIHVDHAQLSGGDVMLWMADTVTPPSTDTTAIKPLTITARLIELSDVRYRMSMMPTIDSLGADVPQARLVDALVDLETRRIKARYLAVDSVRATYFTPSEAYLQEHPLRETTSDTIPINMAEMWTITADSVRLTGQRAIYAMRDAEPQPGLDFSWLEASDIDIAVDSFYNCGPTIRVPLKRLEATERCGIELGATGVFSIDTAFVMHADGFKIYTPFSSLDLRQATMGAGDLTTDPSLPIALEASARIAQQDMRLAFPAVGPMLKNLTPATELTLQADLGGTSGSLDIRQIAINLPRYLDFKADGHVDNFADFENISGLINLNGTPSNLNSLKPTLLDARMAKEINLPPTRLRGQISYSPSRADGQLTATTPRGHVALKAEWFQKAEGYDVALTLDSLAVDEFMPSLGIGGITAHATASGQGYDPFSPRTHAQASVTIDRAVVNGRTYVDASLEAQLDSCRATGKLSSSNPNANFLVHFAAEMLPDKGYRWDVDGDISNIDLLAMKLSETPLDGSLKLNTTGTIYPATNDIDARLTITDLRWRVGEARLEADSIKGGFRASDSTLLAGIRSADMGGYVSAYCSLDSLLACLTATTEELDSQMAHRSVDIRRLQQRMPRMDAAIRAGSNNLLTQFLATDKMGWSQLRMEFHNDSLFHFGATALNFYTGDTRLDTIQIEAMQHGKFLVYKASVNNRPGTMDNFAFIGANGYLADDKMSLMVRQKDINGKLGFLLGLNTTAADSTITLRFVPYTPTIGGKQWTVNNDNHITYNFYNQHLDANLAMTTDKSYIKLFTEHVEGGDSLQEDVVMQMAHIQLKDWLSISPFAPPIKGDLGANMRFRWNEQQLTGKGTVDLNDFYFGRERVGSFTLGVDVANKANGTLYADASLLVDSIKVITARGSLNDSTALHPFNLDFSMIHLPLRIVNPFLPKDVARLSGVLNGEMDITGTMTEPIFNGYLDFDTTSVKVVMLGSSFKFSEEKIPVDSNVVSFNDFTIVGVNDSAIHVNGTVDARHITDIACDLKLSATDFQIVNTTRARSGADVYGKANIDLDASVKGNMQMMMVNAQLDVLPSTNVTYVMADAASTLSSQSTEGMVHFVNFADSAQVAEADTIDTHTMTMLLNAKLNVQAGSVINVDLPNISLTGSAGNNKVSIQGSGELDYTQNPMDDGRLTGRFNINGGYVRYTPPVMGEKVFNFQEGSYVAFNGDMLNPTLNIHAVDNLKANVTQEGQNSRIIDFEITVSITNTLENMNVAFDLSTPDDITVENELTSMSPDQRANQAMNLLLYNVYTGPSTKATSNLAANPLYTFLESQLNSWAANNIRGVDISFGIDQYNKTTDGYTSQATSYSYKVSKSLFDDRIKIIVGGNYTTDANADENFSQNLINDISFEYMLNHSGSMYLRVFRHIGYESILEGEVTQTGVGFVVKRQLNSLRDLFNWTDRLRRRDKKEITEETPAE